MTDLMKIHPAPWRKAEANTTIPVKDANGRTVASVKYGTADDTVASAIEAIPELISALRAAQRLLDSVAFVSNEGDTDELLQEISAALLRAQAN